MPPVKIGLTQVAFGLVLLVQLFFLVDGAALFPAYWTAQGWDKWLPIYLALTFAAMALTAFVHPQGAFSRTSPFGDPFGVLPLATALFTVGFLASFALFQLPALRTPLAIPKGDAIPTAAFTIFVVGFTEELLFRWVVLQILLIPLGDIGAIVGSSAAWAAFHFAAYGEQPSAILFIFLLGIAFGAAFLATRKMAGIGLVWGLHSGWNLGVAGILTVVR